jgi:hypothetical protein
MTSGGPTDDSPDTPSAAVRVPESWDARLSERRRVAPQVPDFRVAPSVRPVRPAWLWPAVGAGLVATVVAVVYLALPDAPAAGPPKMVTATSRPAPPPKPRPTTTATASATSSATASKASLPPPAPENPTLCFAQLMAPDAFGEISVDVSFCCEETAAYGTTIKLKSEVVRAGGHGVSDGMKEWSQLGWYEMAAFAVMRTHCCPDAPALVVGHAKIAPCRLEESLAWMANAIDDGDDMQQAVLAYTNAVRCITSKGYSESFGQYDLPQGGELTIIDRILQRIAKLRKPAQP